MIIPDIISINVTSENWGSEPDDFWVAVQADIGSKNSIGSETFTFNIVSPERLRLMLKENGIEIGRGLLIMENYNIKIIENAINQLIQRCKGDTWEEVVSLLCRYAYWEYEN